MTPSATVEFIQFLDACNINGRNALRFLVKRDGQDLEYLVAIAGLISGNNTPNIMVPSIFRSRNTECVDKEGAAIAVGIGKGSAIAINSDFHVLEQYIVCPIGFAHLCGGDDVGIYLHIGGSGLEAFEGLQLRHAVIGRFLATETCRNEVANLVNLISAAIDNTIALLA